MHAAQREGLLFIETSALDGSHVEEAFTRVAGEVRGLWGRLVRCCCCPHWALSRHSLVSADAAPAPELELAACRPPQIHGIVRKRRLESQAGDGEDAAPAVPRGISIPVAAAQPAQPAAAQSRCCTG